MKSTEVAIDSTVLGQQCYEKSVSTAKAEIDWEVSL
jgi:hypothetical protein